MNEKPTEDPRELVLQALRTKSCMKQDIHARTTELFAEFKEVVEEIAMDLAEEVKPRDERLVVSFVDRNPTSCELTVAGDIIIFNMHTNVFRLDQSHHLWKTSYLAEDETRGYFGLINMYNFLRDSMRFNRDRDLGYLVARLFLNREGHYFMQGRRQLGFLYSNLQEEVMERAKLKQMLYTVIHQVIEFDLLAPPYDQVNPVSVSEIKELYANQQLSTGKRLGFRFQADVDDIG